MARPFTPSIHKEMRPSVEAADTVAAEALTFLAAEPERLRRFLDITGLSPLTLRQAAAAPDFTASLLDYIAADERCLLAFAAESGREPAAIERLRAVLAPPPVED